MRPQHMFNLKICLGVVFMLAAYCLAYGRGDAWLGWCYAAFFLITLTTSHVVLAKVAPDLVAERVTWPSGVMRWDKPIVTWLMFSPIAASVVAGLDARQNGITSAKSKIVLGFVIAALGSALTHWSMAANRFYAPVVRIQTERGHKVIQSGPYALIRHPGNVGNIVLSLGIPLMLASRWAWIPAGLTVVVIVFRTVLEDRMLCRELPGYLEFAQRTRSRLIPGVW